MEAFEEKKYDVLVIGAGAAGMRAAIAASDEGASVCLVSKSLLGKAHTVMAEGGAAAARSGPVLVPGEERAPFAAQGGSRAVGSRWRVRKHGWRQPGDALQPTSIQ